MTEESPLVPLTRDDLAEMLQHVHGGPMTAARKTIDGLLGAMAEALADGREVHLHGFGRFVHAVKGGRRGVAPNGTPYDTAARLTVRFRPARQLSRAVSGETDD